MTDVKIISKSLLFKNSVYNLIGMALPLIVGVIAIPFAIRGLSKDVFGILTLVWVILGYLSLLDFGIARASTKYTSEFLRNNNRHQISDVFWTSIIINIILGCTTALMFYFLCPVLVRNVLNIEPDLHPVAISTFRLLSFFLPILLISVTIKGMLGAAQRFDLVNLVHIPLNISSFIVPALTYLISMDLFKVTLIILILRMVGAQTYLILCLRIYPECRHLPRLKQDVLKRLFSYGGWVTITGFISPLLVNIDRFFVGSMLTMQSLTFYSAPLEALQRMRIVPQAIMNTLFPEFSQGLQQDNENRLTILYWKAFKIILLLTGIFCVITGIFASDILSLWLGSEFVESSTQLVQIFSIGVFFNLMAHVPFTFLQGIGRPDIPAKFHIIEAPIYILMLWLFVAKFGLIGAAIVWSFRVLADFILLFIKSVQYLPQRKIPVTEKELLQKTGGFLIVFLLLCGFVFFIGHSLPAKIVGLGLLCVVSLFIVSNFLLADDERQLIFEMRQKLKR